MAKGYTLVVCPRCGQEWRQPPGQASRWHTQCSQDATAEAVARAVMQERLQLPPYRVEYAPCSGCGWRATDYQYGDAPALGEVPPLPCVNPRCDGMMECRAVVAGPPDTDSKGGLYG